MVVIFALGVCSFTCTFDSLSDESPHEVGAVLTPVWPSEGVHLRDNTKTQ